MPHFTEITFELAMKSFQDAENKGNRWRMGDLLTSQWLQKNKVHLEDIVTFSKSMPDSKIVVIGECPSEGFYIYSQKQKTCFKFEPKLAQV